MANHIDKPDLKWYNQMKKEKTNSYLYKPQFVDESVEHWCY